MKEIVIFRHAQKDSWQANPTLSDYGQKQAQNLVTLVNTSQLPAPSLLISSPKKRAQQTFIPLQEKFQIPLVLDPALDERSNHETGREFEARIKQFIHYDLVQNAVPCMFLCTHLDWLEIFAWTAPLQDDLMSEVLHLPPAHYYYFQIEETPSAPWVLHKKGGVE